MIHILFKNILYLDVTRYREVEVSNDLAINFIGEDSIKLHVLEHPTVQTILGNVPDEQKEETKKAIVYQTFNLICQRFTGKSLVDGVLIPIENDVLNLDGALRTLAINKEEKKDEKVDK